MKFNQEWTVTTHISISNIQEHKDLTFLRNRLQTFTRFDLNENMCQPYINLVGQDLQIKTCTGDFGYSIKDLFKIYYILNEINISLLNNEREVLHAEHPPP